MIEDYSLVNNLCLMKNRKYKTINLYLYHAYPYDLKRELALYLLTCFLGDYSNTYNTKEKMLKAKDNLYGINIYSQYRLKANLLLCFIKITFINPKFLNDVTSDDYLSFIKECLNNVYFSNELLDEFKRNYKDIVKRKLDNPSNLAKNRTMQILAEEENKLKIYDFDHIDAIDSISLDDVKKVYEELKEKFSLDVFLIGDYDDKILEFAKSFKSNNEYYLDNKPIDINDLGEIIEDKKVSQSNLNVIYKCPYTRTHKDFYAYMLGNCLLGMVPTSLLFEEVREKLSLCYYISILDYKNEGLVKIYTAIEGKNKDTVLKQIDIQINRLINKDYDDEKIDLARTLLIDSLESTADDYDAYVDFIYHNKLNKVDCNLNKYIDMLYKVNKDDISEVFKTYKHVLTYMLNGVENGENL